MVDSPHKLFLYRRELARYALVHITAKNPLVRQLALAILDEFPTADPAPRSPQNTRVIIASSRAVQKLRRSSRNKQGLLLAPPIITAAEVQVRNSLARARLDLQAARDRRKT